MPIFIYGCQKYFSVGIQTVKSHIQNFYKSEEKEAIAQGFM